jgi:hypothetical protein
MTDVELALAGLGQRLEAEALAPDLVEAVLARLDAPTPLRRRRPWRPVLLAAAVLALLAAGALAASPGLRADLRSWLEGSRIEVRTDTVLPPATIPRSVPDLGLGVQTPPAEAATRLGLPRLPQPFGPPDAVLVDQGPVVTAVWLPGHGLPPVRAVPAVGALLTMLPLAPMSDPMVLGKVLGGGTDVSFVALPGAAGDEGVWIAGAPHAVQLFDGSTLRFRLAANVLVWRVGLVVYRLESALGQDAAISAAVRTM